MSAVFYNRYFDFNPAPSVGKVSSETHGLVPVWGFGTVVTSNHPKIHEGEQVYGYFAPTRYLLVPVSPSDVNKHAFYVPRPHLPAGMSLGTSWTPIFTSIPQIVDHTIKSSVVRLTHNT